MEKHAKFYQMMNKYNETPDKKVLDDNENVDPIVLKKASMLNRIQLKTKNSSLKYVAVFLLIVMGWAKFFFTGILLEYLFISYSN